MNGTGVLALEDGSVFRGNAFGAAATIAGEVVFNTSMTGYQEIITDPSYYGQIVTMTAPMIGNYGINEEDLEADSPMLAGFVVRELSPIASNWRSTGTLHDYLLKNNIPGLEGVDTRAITRKIREVGAMKACISTEDISDEEAVKRAREWVGIVGADYVKEVTCKEPFVYSPEEATNWPYNPIESSIRPTELKRKQIFKIAALDLGAKKSIFRELAYHGFEIHVFPATTSAEEIKAISPDGIFLSNGPGDPEPVTYVHDTVRALIDDYPIFGICLGHQIITHAIGAKTYKLKFGHRGGNQPVKSLEDDFVAITAHNHGFATEESSLESCGAVVTEINLNDKTVAGIRLKDKPVFSVQYHPEAGPGPSDANPNFEKFYQLVAESKA
ncbi:glutamine-hydrolyzing carbamoyl-phosphate synthase small subunit [Puniceicoccaceae bacterium K14]|nr:glutamine-hydrolyzing carbamoyl-phosphate synthase small subunit [Puniceicoccaceae bacterium K14]